MNKKTRKNRLISLVLAVCLVLSFMIVGVPVSAEDSVTLDVIIRDFKMDGKLFEGEVASIQGLVRTKLGSDKKPDFSDPGNPSKPFPDWEIWDTDTSVKLTDLKALFNDVPGVNKSTTKKLTMTKDEDGFYSIKKT